MAKEVVGYMECGHHSRNPWQEEFAESIARPHRVVRTGPSVEGHYKRGVWYSIAPVTCAKCGWEGYNRETNYCGQYVPQVA